MSVNELKEVRSPKSASWQSLPLSKVCEKVSKVKRKTMPSDDKLLYLDIGGIDNNVNKVKSHKTYTWGEAPSRAQQIVQVGDTLFSTVRTYLKNIAKIENKLYNGQIASSGFTVLRPKADMLDENYLFYYTLSTSFLNSLSKLQIGSSYPAVRDKDVFAQKIPLPPLPEQRAIVAKLERLFTELDRSVAELEAARAKVGVYRQSVLDSLVSSSVSVPVAEVVVDLSQGWSPKCKRVARDNPTQWAVIKTSALQPMAFVEVENKVLPSTLEPREQHEIEVGDVLITRAGPRTRVGICCRVRSVLPRLINCDKVYRIKLDPDKVSSHYFEYALNTPRITNALDRIKTGGSDSGLNLTQSRFLKLNIPLPSLEEQNNIVQNIESRFSVADHLERTIEESLARARGLRQGMLKRAFAGELV